MTTSQDMKKPHLCLKQAVQRRRRVLVSAVVLNHIFITQLLPQPEKTPTGSRRGVHGLLKWLDDPEYQRMAGLGDERRPCLGLCDFKRDPAWRWSECLKRDKLQGKRWCAASLLWAVLRGERPHWVEYGLKLLNTLSSLPSQYSPRKKWTGWRRWKEWVRERGKKRERECKMEQTAL